MLQNTINNIQFLPLPLPLPPLPKNSPTPHHPTTNHKPLITKLFPHKQIMFPKSRSL